MTDPQELNVVLASNAVRDERLGTSKVPMRIAAELAALGVRVTSVFASDLPQVRPARLADMTAPLRMAAALARIPLEQAQIVDISGWDAWAYALWARPRRPRQVIVARSNGLWRRSLPFKFEGADERSAPRRLVSGLVQGTLCRWERASIRAADLAVFGARGDAEYAVAHGWKRPEQVAVVAPAADDAFASDVPLEARSGLFYVGTFLYQKGGAVAADAMAIVMTRRPDVTATFVGPGVPSELILAHFPPALHARVRIVEKVPADEVARQLRSAAVLLWPALYEGFGMSLLEAMRAGLVVVATRTGAGGEVVRDGENGLSVPFSDVPATAAAVERLLADPALRVRLATAAVNETRSRSWRAAASQLVDAYRATLAARRTRSV
jgi:glycosyltransferase involved in cell wall biosynthesis